MISWLADNIANILVLTAVLLAVILAVRSMVRDKKAGKSSCGCGCANCAMVGKCHQHQK